MKNKVFIAIIIFGSWLSIMHGSMNETKRHYFFDEIRWLSNINKLIKAIELKDRNEIDRLVEIVPVDYSDQDGWTPLLAAAERGDNDVLAELITVAKEQAVFSEKFINHSNKWGVTALMIAAKNGHLGVVKLLLKEGADPNLRGGDFPEGRKKTALAFAAENRHDEVAYTLLENGADADAGGPYVKGLMDNRY